MSGGLDVVARRELADLWLRARVRPARRLQRAPERDQPYLVATNQAINFIEQREAVGLTLQVAVAVGALLSLLAAADALSGERDRGSLEALLWRRSRAGSSSSARAPRPLSLWLAAFAVAVPYVWFLGHGIGLVAVPLAGGAPGRHAPRRRVCRPWACGQRGPVDEPR